MGKSRQHNIRQQVVVTTGGYLAHQTSKKLREVRMGDICIGSERPRRMMMRVWFFGGRQQLTSGEVYIGVEDVAICLVALNLGVGCHCATAEREAHEVGAGRKIIVRSFMLRINAICRGAVSLLYRSIHRFGANSRGVLSSRWSWHSGSLFDRTRLLWRWAVERTRVVYVHVGWGCCRFP